MKTATASDAGSALVRLWGEAKDCTIIISCPPQFTTHGRIDPEKLYGRGRHIWISDSLGIEKSGSVNIRVSAREYVDYPEMRDDRPFVIVRPKCSDSVCKVKANCRVIVERGGIIAAVKRFWRIAFQWGK